MSQRWFFGNRLTPEPELEGHRTGVVRTDDRVGASVLKGWAREMRKEVFIAMKNKVVILDNYSMSEHQTRIDKKPPAPSEPGWRQGELIVIEGETSRVLVDSRGAIAAWIFPKFMKGHTLDYHNEIVTKHAEHQFPAAEHAKGIIRGARTNGQARGGADKYTTSHGIFGTVTYAIAWHQQLHQKDTSFAPSKDIVDARSVQQTVQRDLFFCSFRDISWKINTMISLVPPELHKCLSALRPALADHPSCGKLLSIWGSIFPGHSLICNRTSGEHIDRNGIRRGFEAILAGGSFSGGSLYLKDIHVRLQLLPGTLILFDGTGLRHEVLAWEGEQRYSHAFFAHRSVLAELGIPHDLPEVLLDSVRSRLSRGGAASGVPSLRSRISDAPGITARFKRPSEQESSANSKLKRKCLGTDINWTA